LVSVPVERRCSLHIRYRRVSGVALSLAPRSRTCLPCSIGKGRRGYSPMRGKRSRRHREECVVDGYIYVRNAPSKFVASASSRAKVLASYQGTQEEAEAEPDRARGGGRRLAHDDPPHRARRARPPHQDTRPDSRGPRLVGPRRPALGRLPLDRGRPRGMTRVFRREAAGRHRRRATRARAGALWVARGGTGCRGQGPRGPTPSGRRGTRRRSPAASPAGASMSPRDGLPGLGNTRGPGKPGRRCAAPNGQCGVAPRTGPPSRPPGSPKGAFPELRLGGVLRSSGVGGSRRPATPNLGPDASSHTMVARHGYDAPTSRYAKSREVR
jgi:hypothetical protein